MTSSVYFIQNTRTGYVKIGHSRRVKARLLQLQSASADALDLLGVIAGGVEAEAELHIRFNQFRVRGEWFEGRPELLAQIAGLIADSTGVEPSSKLDPVDPMTQQAREWVLMLIDEAGSSVGLQAIAQSSGVTPGLIENLKRNRIKAITARDFEAIRSSAVRSMEAKLAHLWRELAVVQALVQAQDDISDDCRAENLQRLEIVMLDARRILQALAVSSSEARQ